jgi:hypothetical protein
LGPFPSFPERVHVRLEGLPTKRASLMTTQSGGIPKAEPPTATDENSDRP